MRPQKPPKRRAGQKGSQQGEPTQREVEIDLSQPGREVELRPVGKPFVVPVFLMVGGIISFICLLIGVVLIFYFISLDKLEPVQQIERIESLLYWLFRIIFGVLISGLGYLGIKWLGKKSS
jgi:hypothetical protein